MINRKHQQIAYHLAISKLLELKHGLPMSEDGREVRVAIARIIDNLQGELLDIENDTK